MMLTVGQALQSKVTGASIRTGAWASRKVPPTVFMVTMLVTGACSIVYEYIVSTSLTYLLGSSIEQFSITIGVMIAMMGAGTALQSRIRRFLGEIFVMTELLLVVIGGTTPFVLQWAYTVMPDSFSIVKFAYMAVIGLLIGIEVPLMMRINEDFFAKDLKDNMAGTWAFDYLGGFLGVLGWLWLLVHQMPLTHIAVLTAAGNLFVAGLSLCFFWKRGILTWRWKSGTPMAVMTFAVLGVLIVTHLSGGAWMTKLNQDLYEDPIIFQQTTKYQNLVVTRGMHPFVPGDYAYDLWINGNRQFNSVDEAIYHENLVHPAMNLAARHERVLILGGGDGMALREVLKYEDVREVTLVDLDPEMVKLFKEDPVLRGLNGDAFHDARVTTSLDYAGHTSAVGPGPTKPVMIETGEYDRVKCTEVQHDDGSVTSSCQGSNRYEDQFRKVADVNVFNVDADRFISQPTGFWDVVIIDLPDPDSIELAKLYSKEFYGKVKDRMSPDGVVVVQATSPYHARDAYLCILRTMTAAGLNVMPYHANVPSFGDWGWLLGSSSLDQQELTARAQGLEGFPVETKEVGAAQLRAALTFNKGDLTSHNDTVSTLMEPVIFSYYHSDGWKVE
jgi:spermidine synthase